MERALLCPHSRDLELVYTPLCILCFPFVTLLGVACPPRLDSLPFESFALLTQGFGTYFAHRLQYRFESDKISWP